MNDRAFPLLDAHCAGCGKRTLYRGFRGVITCSNDDCPNPEAVHQLLAEPFVADHLVIVSYAPGTDGNTHPIMRWTLQHPIAERVGSSPFTCHLGAELPKQREANIQVKPGRYRLEVSPEGRVWHLLELKDSTYA